MIIWKLAGAGAMVAIRELALVRFLRVDVWYACDK
jgi:hypothetical protein